MQWLTRRGRTPVVVGVHLMVLVLLLRLLAKRVVIYGKCRCQPTELLAMMMAAFSCVENAQSKMLRQQDSGVYLNGCMTWLPPLKG